MKNSFQNQLKDIGTDEIDNLKILCRNCNTFKGSEPFLGYQFEGCIKKMLEAKDRYTNVLSHRKINGKIKAVNAEFINMYWESWRILVGVMRWIIIWGYGYR